ncbi:hypothetical protein BGZ61DRAFT_457970 [Ilyonectria robusta]|uniref:uncharacterized protein n=1 Tax=Ilyonectria robusta TaxID=1079257 RepID=UPI001E8CB803|nr:uncharacterized protein BGZ61DRAFT_457970 [Ilyonectria robusta]KAH8674893.1 hypothetical protein BGZ61DRAFT_457970 [Ilyonectria robusta]
MAVSSKSSTTPTDYVLREPGPAGSTRVPHQKRPVPERPIPVACRVGVLIRRVQHV